MAKVLVVDDERMVRSVLRRFLEQQGYDVVEAVDGIDALDMLARGDVDVAIVDLIMPRLDGFGLLREVERHFPGTAVIVISGVKSQLADAKKEFSVLAALGKPFELEEIEATIRSAVG